MTKSHGDDVGFLQQALREMKDDFEQNSPELVSNPGEIRVMIAEFDKILIDYFANDPKSGKEVGDFLNKHITRLVLDSNISDLVAGEINALFVPMIFAFSTGPNALVDPENEIYADIHDFLLFTRNYFAMYLGDPIRLLIYYKDSSQRQLS